METAKERTLKNIEQELHNINRIFTAFNKNICNELDRLNKSIEALSNKEESDDNGD